MPEILGDVRALAYVERWAKKEGSGQKVHFVGKKLNSLGKKILFIRVGTFGSREREDPSSNPACFTHLL